MPPIIREALLPEEILRCHPALKELRPYRADADAFVAQVLRQQREGGYRMIYAEEHGEVCGLAGFRVSENLAWGRFLYVDDLITAERARKRGHARALMDALIHEARKQGCAQLHLDSGVQRFDAHRLYLNAGMRITSHHFGMEL